MLYSWMLKHVCLKKWCAMVSITHLFRWEEVGLACTCLPGAVLAECLASGAFPSLAIVGIAGQAFYNAPSMLGHKVSCAAHPRMAAQQTL